MTRHCKPFPLLREGQVVATDDMKQLLNELYKNEHHMSLRFMTGKELRLVNHGSG